MNSNSFASSSHETLQPPYPSKYPEAQMDQTAPAPNEQTAAVDEKRKSTSKAPLPIPEPAPEYSRHEDPEPALPTIVTEPVYITQHRGVSTFLFYVVAAALVLSILINIFYTGIAMRGFLGSLQHPPWQGPAAAAMNVAPVINIGDPARFTASSQSVQPASPSAESLDMKTLVTTVVSTTTASGSTSVVTTTVPTTVVRVNVVQTSLVVNSIPGPVIKSTSTKIVLASPSST